MKVLVQLGLPLVVLNKKEKRKKNIGSAQCHGLLGGCDGTHPTV